MLSHLGHHDQARAEAQRALDLCRDSGLQSGAQMCLWLLGSVALAVEAYAEAERWLQQSMAIQPESPQARDRGIALAFSCIVALRLGRLRQAKHRLLEALRSAVPVTDFSLGVLAVLARALLYVHEGDLERAVELYALVSRYPFVANSHALQAIAGRDLAAVAATLPPEVAAAAQARGRARDLEATVAELLGGAPFSVASPHQAPHVAPPPTPTHGARAGTVAQ